MNGAMRITGEFDYMEWKRRCERLGVKYNSGHGFFSMVFPSDFCYDKGGVVVEEV